MAPEPAWWVAHTRPRCEKKVAEECVRDGVEHRLPLYRSVKRYRGKVAEFLKPLFPGYVFVRVTPAQRLRLAGCRHVAALLEPPDPAEFLRQMDDILRALDTGREMRVLPEIRAGSRVRVIAGPLRGLEGRVESRAGVIEVHLRLDFIGQAAAVRVAADELEPA